MIKKRRSLLLILFFVFTLQTAQIQAFSWSSLTQSLTEWVSKRPQFAIGATFAVLIGYLYFSGSKKPILGQAPETENTASKPEDENSLPNYTIEQKPATKNAANNSEDESSIPYYDIQQIKVVHQGPNNNCGYHALKNALIIKQNEKNVDLTQDLSFETHNEIQLGEWKEIIKHSRQTAKLKNWFKTICSFSVNNPELPEEITFVSKDDQKKLQEWIYNQYTNKIKNLYSTAAEIILDALNKEQVIEYEISKKVFLSNLNHNQILADLEQSISPGPNVFKKLSQDLRTKVIDHISDIDQHVDMNIAGLTINKTFVDALFNLDHATPSLKYENLQGDEIKLLLKEEADSQYHQYFSFIDDIDQALPDQEALRPVIETEDNANEEISLIENFQEMKQAWHDPEAKDYTHLFMLGTMSEANRDQAGHWYTVAAHKKDRKKNYYVADSLGYDRTNDPRVLRLIEAIEKKPKQAIKAIETKRPVTDLIGPIADQLD